jgi:hypothetical protein
MELPQFGGSVRKTGSMWNIYRRDRKQDGSALSKGKESGSESESEPEPEMGDGRWEMGV